MSLRKFKPVAGGLANEPAKAVAAPIMSRQFDVIQSHLEAEEN